GTFSITFGRTSPGMFRVLLEVCPLGALLPLPTPRSVSKTQREEPKSPAQETYMLFTRTNSPSFSRATQRIFFWVLAVFAGLVYAQAALASNITIANPSNGTTSTSPV